MGNTLGTQGLFSTYFMRLHEPYKATSPERLRLYITIQRCSVTHSLAKSPTLVSASLNVKMGETPLLDGFCAYYNHWDTIRMLFTMSVTAFLS